MSQDYIKHREFADKFVPMQQSIIDRYKSRLDFNKSTAKFAYRYDEQKDLKENTDIVLYQYYNLRFALRVRNAEQCKYRDLTIRSYKNGNLTEYDKLMNGYGDYMLYCWGGLINNTNPYINEFVMIDLDIFRTKHEQFLLQKDKQNKDGGMTRFNIYDLAKMIKTDCVIAVNLL